MSDKIQIKDNLSLTVGKIADIKFLIEIIRENYFNQYNVDTPNDRQAIVWEHKQAKALFNIWECEKKSVKNNPSMIEYK